MLGWLAIAVVLTAAVSEGVHMDQAEVRPASVASQLAQEIGRMAWMHAWRCSRLGFAGGELG